MTTLQETALQIFCTMLKAEAKRKPLDDMNFKREEILIIESYRLAELFLTYKKR
jgi:hypothetical protein